MPRSTILAVAAGCLVAGYLVATVPGFDPVNPFAPKQRPVAKLLARVARLGLWLTVFAEPAPTPATQHYAARHPDGGALCHAEGW